MTCRCLQLKHQNAKRKEKKEIKEIFWERKSETCQLEQKEELENFSKAR